jgi:hypothetical protein
MTGHTLALVAGGFALWLFVSVLLGIVIGRWFAIAAPGGGEVDKQQASDVDPELHGGLSQAGSIDPRHTENT